MKNCLYYLFLWKKTKQNKWLHSKFSQYELIFQNLTMATATCITALMHLTIAWHLRIRFLVTLWTSTVSFQNTLLTNWSVHLCICQSVWMWLNVSRKRRTTVSFFGDPSSNVHYWWVSLPCGDSTSSIRISTTTNSLWLAIFSWTLALLG